VARHEFLEELWGAIALLLLYKCNLRTAARKRSI